MYKPNRTPRLGALREVGATPDRFDLATIACRRDPKAGRLLTDGVEWGGHG